MGPLFFSHAKGAADLGKHPVPHEPVASKIAPEAKIQSALSTDSARSSGAHYEPSSYSGEIQSEFKRRPAAPEGDRSPVTREQAPRPRTDAFIQDTRWDVEIDRLADASLHERGGMQRLHARRFTEQDIANMKAVRRPDEAELARMRESQANADGGMERMNARRFSANELARMRALRDQALGGEQRGAARLRQKPIPPVREMDPARLAAMKQAAIKPEPAVVKPPQRPAFVGTPEHQRMMKTLFPSGLQGTQFKQGKFGNCAVLSALQSTLMHQPQRIENMLEPIKSGVRIHLGRPINGKQFVDVDYAELFQKEFKGGIEGPLGVKALERGLARAEKTGAGMDAATLNVLGNGRSPVTTLGFFGGGARASEIHGAQRLSEVGEDATFVLGKIAADPKGTLAVAWTPRGLTDTKLVGQHAYAVSGVDQQRGIVQLVNPHDTSKTIDLPTDQFLKKFYALDYIRPQ